MAVRMRAVMPALEITRFARRPLSGVMALFATERWSYGEDQERTWRALTAPGPLTLVAVYGDDVVGVAHVLGTARSRHSSRSRLSLESIGG
jgi:hypothetical protein